MTASSSTHRSEGVNCFGLQDHWFDDTDESADGSATSPVASTLGQTWKVHQGLGASDVHTGPAGVMNAAFLQSDAVSSNDAQQIDDLDLDSF